MEPIQQSLPLEQSEKYIKKRFTDTVKRQIY